MISNNESVDVLHGTPLADPILAMPAAYDVARRQTFPLPTDRSGGERNAFLEASRLLKKGP